MPCFDKSKRLLKKRDYDHVFKQAKKVVATSFILLYRENAVGHPRLGMAISKKMLAKAHDRNRLKRLLRESFRHQSLLPAIDVVVLAKADKATLQKALMGENMSRIWEKLSLTCVK